MSHELATVATVATGFDASRKATRWRERSVPRRWSAHSSLARAILLLASATLVLACGGGEDAEPTLDEEAAPGGGLWVAAGSATTAQPGEQTLDEAIAELEAIGYVQGSRPAPEATGVTRNEPERRMPGLNFYTSGHEPEALLMDSEGRVLHRWHRSFDEVFPDSPVPEDHLGRSFWRRTHLYPNGDILAIFEGLGIVKLDRDSQILWARLNSAHHDLEVLPDGRIWVLTRKARLIEEVNPEKPILEDFVTLLDADGREQKSVSVLESFRRTPSARILRLDLQPHGDFLHTNTIEVLDGRLAERVPGFRAGNLLVSLPKRHVIAVIDPRRAQVVWVHQGEFRAQHDPGVLANGNLLFFDNQGRGEASSVLELDPESGEVVWSYRGTEAAPFYSETCGTAQRLDNGNTLITESDGGRAFEVTAEGDIVWEFRSPHLAGSRNQFVAAILEVLRLPVDFPTDWARGSDPPEDESTPPS